MIKKIAIGIVLVPVNITDTIIIRTVANDIIAAAIVTIIVSIIFVIIVYSQSVSSLSSL
jgi:hypothetical protein